MNKVELMGRLTRDPDLRTTQSGMSVANFTIAIDRRHKGQDGERQTDFIPCLAWDKTAELIKRWFFKGRMICVVGFIQTRKYTDKDGNNRTSVEVAVNEVYFCGDKVGNVEQSGSVESGHSGFAQPSSEPRQGEFVTLPDDDDDELPF